MTMVVNGHYTYGLGGVLVPLPAGNGHVVRLLTEAY